MKGGTAEEQSGHVPTSPTPVPGAMTLDSPWQLVLLGPKFRGQTGLGGEDLFWNGLETRVGACCGGGYRQQRLARVQLGCCARPDRARRPPGCVNGWSSCAAPYGWHGPQCLSQATCFDWERLQRYGLAYHYHPHHPGLDASSAFLLQRRSLLKVGRTWP